MVLCWHYLYCQIPFGKSALAELKKATLLGWSGVDLFFVLSGFLIGGILLDHRHSANRFQVFYLRRICRIFPLYFLIISIAFGLSMTSLGRESRFSWLFSHLYPFWTYATFSQNITMAVKGGFGGNSLGVTWSIALEEQFYAVVPFLVLLLRPWLLASVLIFAISAAPFLRLISPGMHGYMNVPWRTDSILLGVLLALLVRWHPFITYARQHTGLLVTLFFTLFSATFLLYFYPHCFGVFRFTFFGFFYSLLVLIAFLGDQTIIGRSLRTPILLWFGKLSFGIYLLHQLISGLLHGFLLNSAPRLSNFQDAGVTLLSLATTLLIAFLSHRYYESFFIHLGHRFKYTAKAPE